MNMNINKTKIISGAAKSVCSLARNLKVQLLILLAGIFAFAGCVNYNDPVMTGGPGTAIQDRAANLVGDMLGFHPSKWPDSPQKQAALKRCAELMRSSVDTNWLAMIAGKLANQPAVLQFTNRSNDGIETITLVTNADLVLHIEDFSKRLASTMNEIASCLTNSKLKTFIAYNYKGVIVSPRENEKAISFNFWSENGPVKNFKEASFDEPAPTTHNTPRAAAKTTSSQTADAVHLPGVAAEFSESGRLVSFEILTPEHIESANFGGDGQPQHFFWRGNNMYAISIDMDVSNNVHVKLIPLGKNLRVKLQP